MKNKPVITNQQIKLNLEFVEYCKKSDLVAIKQLCEQSERILNNPKPTISHFAKFLRMCKLPVPVSMEPPTVNFFAENCAGLITLANKGDITLLSYITSLPLFKEQFNNLIESDKNRFADTFFNAVELGHMNCVQLLAPLVENINLVFQIFDRFETACRNGDINTVKFLTTTTLLENNGNASYMINTQYSEFRPHAEGFVSACESGHLNVVKYLTSDKNLKEKINLDLIDKAIYIEERSIMEHFVFDLDLPSNHPFLRLVIDPNILEELLEKRELMKELSYELNTNTEQSNKKINKI